MKKQQKAMQMQEKATKNNEKASTNNENYDLSLLFVTFICVSYGTFETTAVTRTCLPQRPTPSTP